MKTVFFSIMNANKSGRFGGISMVCLALCVLSGCSTIQFVQHEQAVQTTTVNRWHHSTLNGMVEISKPLNVQSICGERAWTTITTEFTLLNALPVIIVPSTSLVSFYSAWTNKVNCYEVVNAGKHQSPELKLE